MPEGAFLVGRSRCYGQEYVRGTAKTEKCHAKNKNMVEFPQPRPGHAYNGIYVGNWSSYPLAGG